MTKTEDWQNYLEKLSDIPKQYQKGYKVALSMIDVGKLQEQLLFYDTESAKLLPFFLSDDIISFELRSIDSIGYHGIFLAAKEKISRFRTASKAVGCDTAKSVPKQLL